MAFKLKTRTQFPASVTASSPLALVKTGLRYAFGFDVAALQTSLDPLYIGVNDALTNGRLAKTANYTVGNNDKGATIALGGSAFYTLTFNAAGAYDANFSILVVNEDTARAKTVAINGFNPFFLYPRQSILVFNQNGAWQVLGRSRWKIALNTTIYCNQSTGNDANDGLAVGSPKASVQAALYQITNDFDYLSGIGTTPVVTVLMGANDTTGVHFGPQGLVGGVSGGDITIDGGGFSISCAADTDDAFHLFFGAIVYLKNITIIPGTSHGGLSLERGAKAFIFAGCTFGPSAAGSSGGAQIALSDGGSLEIDASYTISGSAGFHIWAHHGSVVRIPSAIAISFSADASFVYFALAQKNSTLDFCTGSTVNLNAHTVSGTKYVAQDCSTITSGSGVPSTWFPGNIVGTQSNGSSVDGLMSSTIAQGGTGTANGPSAVLLGYAKAINLNAIADTAITLTIPAGATFRIQAGVLVNNGTTASLTTARVGVFSAAGGGGSALFADQAVSAITTNAVNTNAASLNLAIALGAAALNFTTVYLRVGTAQGAAASGDFYLYGFVMP